MKLYTDADGKFQVYIPLKWAYQNHYVNGGDIAPHSFSKFDDTRRAFQISCKPINEHVSQIIKNKGLVIQNSNTNTLNFVYQHIVIDSWQNHTWMCAVDDHFILITYLFDLQEVTEEDIELEEIKKIISTFKFIKPTFREKVKADRRFNLFMISMTATIDLMNQAMMHGSFIELVILLANRIDGLLRLALILNEQLDKKTDYININLLFQDDMDKVVSERDIYKKALNAGVIDSELFNELESLYKERNKVVHRYIITDLRTEQVYYTAQAYQKLEIKIDNIICYLESQQHDMKIGMYGKGEHPNTGLDHIEIEKIKSQVRDKHGRIEWPNKWDSFNPKSNVGNPDAN